MERNKPEQSEEVEVFVHPDPVTDAALNWLFMLQAAPDDETLRADFEIWRNASHTHAKTFMVVSEAWDLPEMDIAATNIATRRPEHITPLHEDVAIHYQRPRRRTWSNTIIATAAMVLLAVGVQQYPALMLQWQSNYLTTTGLRDEIILPDGSHMTLNTASAVSIDFEGDKRHVTLLQGEAYFDVVPDTSRPFTVAATFSEVEVKGTAFSVRTETGYDTVVLEHGHVEVAHLPARLETASLVPGDSITASATALSAITKTDPVNALAWLKGMVVFENQPFAHVMQEVGRYYNHSIIILNDDLGQIKVNGNYRLDNPERAIRSLATAAGASVTRLPGGIIILR